MPTSPNSTSSSSSTSKPNPIKSFVRKKFFDTSIFKSLKSDTTIINKQQQNKDNIRNNNNNVITRRKTISVPILISNPNNYYKGAITNITNINNNISCNNVFKPLPRRLSTIDNTVDISLFSSSPDSNIQFNQHNMNEWKKFICSYSQGQFDSSIPKKPKSLRKNFDCKVQISHFDNNEENDDNDDNYEENDNDDISYLPPPMPPNEYERRKALWRFKILDTSSTDVNFTRIVSLVKEHFNASVSMISLIESTHQWFKAEDGMGCSGTTREISFCGHAILQKNGEPFVVLDATKDWRFRNNPLVTNAPFIRFYAGALLQTDDGYNIGTLCVIDRKPRTNFSKEDCEILKRFAKVVMRELELWTDTLRLRVRNKMQESIAEFSKFCMEAQLANNNEENRRNSNICTIGDPIMKQCFNMAVKLMKDTLNVDTVYLLEMPYLYYRRLSITSHSSSGVFLKAPPSDTPSSSLRFLASAGQIELTPEDLKSPMNTSFFAYLMQNHSQGLIYQNDLPQLPTLFPDDVHSGIVVPIYDNSHNAFGFLIAMTKDSKRVFEEEERIYLSNFGVNVVSEVLKRRVIIADRAKGAFISSISHELRTPLHGILASCELMEESKLNEAQTELIKTVQGCGTSLISIINSVLDYAKLESERDYAEDSLNQLNQKKFVKDRTDKDQQNRNNNISNKESRERVDLVKLLEEVSEACFVGQQMVTAIYNSNNDKVNDFTNDNISDDNLITQTRRKQVYELLHPHQFQHQQCEEVTIMIDVDPRDDGWFVMAEDGALKQMLMNIIGNSLKFTKKGHVLISLTSLPYSPLCEKYKNHSGAQDSSIPDSRSKKVHALITITDTGCGISESFLTTNMFQPFSQENSLQVGTGLGLSIVKLLVDKMHGELTVESEVGVGTRFRVWLDFDQACPEIEKGPENDDLIKQNPSDKKDDLIDIGEKQRKIILEEIKQKTFVVKCAKGKLKEVIERYFHNWLKVKDLILEEEGSDDVFGDITFIIDNINQLKKMISKVDSKLTPIVYTTTLARHGKIANFVEELQREIEKNTGKRRKVVILTRPCGPRKLEKAIVSVFSSLNDVVKEQKDNISNPSYQRPQLIMTPPISEYDQNDDNSKDYVSYFSSERKSSLSNPPPTLNVNDELMTSIIPSLRPPFNRSTTLPNLPLSENNEPKFLPIPKSDFMLTPSTSPLASPKISASLPTLPNSESHVNSLSFNELKKSKSINSLSGNSGPKVLVVEDNAVNRMILASFLKKRGIIFEEAENGAIGVEKFKKALEDDENSGQRGFDVVLMDIQMPVMNGNVATAEIRKIENEFRNSKFLLSTSSTTTLTKSSIPVSESNNQLKSNNQKNKFLSKRISSPDFQHNNTFSITNLLKPRMSIKISKNSTKQKLSPLPSPTSMPTSPSPSFTAKSTTNTRSLIFALTGLASEEDKDLAFESGMDGFLTKPVSLKLLEKVLRKWSERNDSNIENSSMESNNSSSDGST